MSVDRLLNILGERLAQIEDPNYGATAYSWGDYTQVMFNIEQNIDNFPVESYIDKIRMFLSRVESLIIKITAKFPSEAAEIKRPIPMEGGPENVPDEIYMLEELEHYQERLAFVIKSRDNFSRNVPTQQIQVLQLPEGFKVEELVKNGFRQQFSIEQAALILYYFQESKLIPNYDYGQLGFLAQYFFGRNASDSRKAVGRAQELKKRRKDLILIRSALKTVLDNIEADIEDAD